jgi:hypothetical protein
MEVLSLDDVTFFRELNVGFLIIRINVFALVMIVGFDPHEAEVGDLAVCVIHFVFFMKVIIWIKIREGVDGRRWTIIQTQETKFFYTISWPFGYH